MVTTVIPASLQLAYNRASTSLETAEVASSNTANLGWW
jgi:hypothetical protein